MSLFAGLFLGVALTMVLLGFLAIDAYRRGYEEAAAERRVWRAELGARRLVARRAPAMRHAARAAS